MQEYKTLADYRKWLQACKVTEENLNATMLAATNAVREAIDAFRVRAMDSHDLFETHFGDVLKEEKTAQSIESQVVAMLLKQEQQEQFAAAVLLQPGDASMPLED